MKTLLQQLQNGFNQYAPSKEHKKEYDDAFETLMKLLDKNARKQVIQIVDSKDLISNELAQENFKCGFC